MPKRLKHCLALCLCALPLPALGAPATLLGWNNLGMHCIDSDYSVFSVLPPYNTIECQLIVNGLLVKSGSGYAVTYEAVADPAGSFNSSSVGKGNYTSYVQSLYGAAVTPDHGLAGWNMPGPANVPQPMLFENTNLPAPGVAAPVNWFRAEGIPISPYDDNGRKNPYPMMRLVARSGTTALATNDIVLPVSDEMDCRSCHASGAGPSAQPAAGWVWSTIPERDFRLNILRLHDERTFAQQPALYTAALAARGFNPQGLYRGVVADGKPVLCAACHASEALGAPSFQSIPPLTASVHAYHSHVVDPVGKITLESLANRAACYRCHPGSTTRCLRGAMGGAVAADGSMEMQCQSCHGSMSTVGSATRVGWFMEPNCGSCHTGTAASNSGQIRFTSAFVSPNGAPRVPTDTTFATPANVPAAGLSLYRFSAGHGGLQCEACHGSTHAEFPSTHANDNVRNLALQGHAGVMIECTSCHISMSVTSSTAAGGPHGMHPLGQSWVSGHPNYAQQNLAACQACHGLDFRGTVLSRAAGNRSLVAHFDGGTVNLNLFRGALVGCYTCHQGPYDDSMNSAAGPTVGSANGTTLNSQTLNLTVSVTPASATLRVISQPANGSLGINNNVLSYFPNPGFTGNDSFTYAAWDGAKNSILATGTVTVAQGPYALGLAALAPPEYPALWPAAFSALPSLTNYAGDVSYDWDFGDGSAHSAARYAQHAYASPGSYQWTLKASAGTVSASTNGVIVIDAPVALSLGISPTGLALSWGARAPDLVIEATEQIGPAAHWSAVTNVPVAGIDLVKLLVPDSGGTLFFRARQAW